MMTRYAMMFSCLLALALTCALRADEPQAATEEAQLNPNDAQALNSYFSEQFKQLAALLQDDPDKAAEAFQSLKKTVDSLNPTNEQSQQLVQRATRAIGQYQGLIETAQKRGQLIGTEAIDIEADAWANGEPLTEEDLKGKVVMLDFFAVWCGPCIATFPHLRDWHEKYSDDGLVIVGVTNYYNYKWDEQAGRATRAPRGETVSPEEEQQMLKEFAESHDLKHPFAVMSDDSNFSEHYGVQGIPHVVIIGREGKVRMVRVGAGEANARDLEEMIQKALQEGV